MNTFSNQIRLTMATVLCLALLGPAALAAGPDTDWPTYGNDAGTTKYAALSQIDADNADDLVLAWQWTTPEDLRFYAGWPFTIL